MSKAGADPCLDVPSFDVRVDHPVKLVRLLARYPKLPQRAVLDILLHRHRPAGAKGVRDAGRPGEQDFFTPSCAVSTIRLMMMSIGFRCHPTIGRISDVKRFASHRRALSLNSMFAPYTNRRASAPGTANSVRSLKPSSQRPVDHRLEERQGS
jgi:hypothetical protein